jgi:hypothetical protein
MTPLLKAAYYVTIGISTLVIGFFFFANMLDTSSPGDTWVHKTVMLVGGLTGFALLGWALRAGHFRGRWVAGIALACIAPLAFALVVAAGLLMFTTVHWQ